MARIRTVKPTFFTSLTIADLPVPVRLTFIGLWTHVDDEGRCVDDARLVKAALWPLDDDVPATEVESHLGALTESSLIARYEVDGRRYIAVRGWSEHQRISRPTASKIPPPESGTERPVPPSDESSLNTHGALTEDSPPEGNREQGTGNREGTTTSDLRPDPDVTDEARQLARQFAEAIKANGHPIPNAKTKARDAWLIEMDRLLRLGPPGEGGHVPDPAEVGQVIAWCAADTGTGSYPGESVTVRSVPKFRERYSELRAKALASPRRNGTSKGVAYAARYREAAAELERQSS